MSTIQEKIDRLRRYKGDMKEAINGRRSTVPVNENMAQYSAGIWGIPEGGGDDKDYINNPRTSPLGYYAIFTASNGTVFVGAASDYYDTSYDSGLYIIKDGIATKAEGIENRHQYFFEASDGTVFIGDYGLYMYRNDQLTQLDDSNGYLTFFETSDGTTYCFNDYAAYAVKDGSGSFISYDNLGLVDECFEASDGTLYIVSRLSRKYIYSIKSGVATKINLSNTVISDNSSFFEASDGTIYFAGKSRLYTIKDGVATEVATLNNIYNEKAKFFEASDGTIYIGGFYASFAAFPPVTKTIRSYSEPGMSYPSIFHELSDGTIVIGNSGSNAGYLWSIKNGTIILEKHSLENDRQFPRCLSMTPVDEGYMTHIYYMTTNDSGVYCIDYNRETGEWSLVRQLYQEGIWDSVKIDENTGHLFCGSSTRNGIRGFAPESSWLVPNTENNLWKLYNNTFISTDRDHQYQYDDQLGVVERTIELPESPKCFITIAKQNTYDV